MEEFLKAFAGIDSDEALVEFIKKYSLKQGGLDQRKNAQTYQVVGGLINGKHVQVVHRWYDKSKPFSIQPDVSKVDLDIDGVRTASVQWNE